MNSGWEDRFINACLCVGVCLDASRDGFDLSSLACVRTRAIVKDELLNLRCKDLSW